MKHFLFDIAGMTGDWKMEDVLEEEMEKIRVQVKSSTGSTGWPIQGGREGACAGGDGEDQGAGEMQYRLGGTSSAGWAVQEGRGDWSVE